MATEAELIDRLARINRALHSGIRRVDYAEGSQTYRDLNEMYGVRRDIERQLAEVRNKAKRSGLIRLNATKGL